MRYRITCGTFRYTHENEICGQTEEYEIDFRLTAGEPRRWGGTRWDEVGFPGSPDDIDFLSARCVEITDDERTYQPSEADGRSMGAVFLELAQADYKLQERLESYAYAESDRAAA